MVRARASQHSGGILAGGRVRARARMEFLLLVRARAS